MSKHIKSPYNIVGFEDGNYGRTQLLILTKSDSEYLLDENDKLIFVYAESFEPIDIPEAANITYWRATSKIQRAILHYDADDDTIYFNTLGNRVYLNNIIRVDSPWLSQDTKDILLVWKN